MHIDPITGEKKRSYWQFKQTVEQIYALFEPNIIAHQGVTNGTKLPLIFAKDALKVVKGSPGLIIKARRVLGVKSHKVAGRHCWTYPLMSPDQALMREKRRRYLCLNHSCVEYGKSQTQFTLPVSEKKLQCPSPMCQSRDIRRVRFHPGDLQQVYEIIRGEGYDAPATYMRSILRHINSTRLYSAKRELNIRHYRNTANVRGRIRKGGSSGEFHWYLVNTEVKEWLSELLLHGDPMTVQQIEKLAAEKGWTSIIMLDACRKETSIRSFIKYGKVFWQENSASLPPPDPSTLAPLPPLDLESEDWQKEPDYLSSDPYERAVRWEFLYRGQFSPETLRAFNIYRNDMKRQYPGEYEHLSNKFIDRMEDVKRLNTKVRKLEKTISKIVTGPQSQPEFPEPPDE